MPAALPLRHFLLALAVVAVWGVNFVVIKFALGALPPILMAALRFGLVLLPGLFFFARPAVPLGNLATYGLLIGAGQFGLLYVAMNGHISPGLASLVIQVQVFFTIGLAMRISGERVRRFQWLALLLAAGGIAVIMLHTDGSTTPFGLFLVLLAALAWAGGNIAAKQGAPTNILAYVVWSSAFAVPPLIALSLAVEGWAAISAATITPMAMLVPVFGMGASALMLDEALPPWKLAAAALVMAGLALNLLWPRLRAALA